VGLYHLTYSAVNADGLSSSTSRVVIVYDPTAPPTDLGGTYTCGIVRSPGGRTFVNLTASITKLAPGFFYCSDFFGGFYNLGSNYKYGPGGCMTGYFMLNANNTITVISSYVQIWSNSLTGLTNGVYTSATKTLVWDALWAGYDFKVTLVKN
jgi:hypothetical protein